MKTADLATRSSCRPEPAPAPGRWTAWGLAAAAGVLVLAIVWYLPRLVAEPARETPTARATPAPLPQPSASTPKPAEPVAALPDRPPAEEQPTTPVTLAPAEPVATAAATREPPSPAPADPAPAAEPAALYGPPEPAPAPVPLKRIREVAEEDLRKQLAWANEIGLGVSSGRILDAHVAAMRRDLRFQARANLIDATPLLDARPDLRNLPYRHGPSVQLDPQAARTLGALGRKLRVYLDLTAPRDAEGRRGKPTQLRSVLRAERRGNRPEWLRAEAIPTMMQLLMHEDTPLRLMLIDLLAEINDPRSSVALARRAVFDLSAEVRQAAVEALKERRPQDTRPVFLQALRYPWAPAAEHAAEALAALGDREAVPHLVTLLRQPDPALPVAIDRTRTVIRDVVRADHQNNCLMCHAPSLHGKDAVLGQDPNLTIPVKSRVSAPGGGGRGRGWGGTAITGRAPLLVRADITFLRQDFSVQLPSQVPGLATEQDRRFDFVVRTQLVSQKTAAALRKSVGDRPTYPQRDAVLFALRELTGKDAGDRTEAWQELYPRAEIDVAAARLSGELLRASAVRCEQLLAKLRDGEGAGYTEALASAIAGLKGVFPDRARDALARRLARLPAEDLRGRLRDGDPEIRRAAVRACVEKEDRAAIAELTDLLEDADPLVARQAEAALKSLAAEE